MRLIQDGGFERFFTERPSPRVTAKAVYYLSDQSEPGRGNTCEIYGTPSRFPRTRVTKLPPFQGSCPARISEAPSRSMCRR